MNHDYADIRDRIGEPPIWFDENAVPRYCEFAPADCANIYACEAVLAEVACQGCGDMFQVAFTRMQYANGGKSLKAAIADRSLYYGDPPNVGCCGSGPTMNSVPRRVLQYWHRHHQECVRGDGPRVIIPSRMVEYMTWRREPSLEVNITPDWANQEEKPA